MRNWVEALALVCAGLVAFGCGDQDTPSTDRHVAAFRAASGFEFQSCGVLHTPCLEFDCGFECSEERESIFGCIDAAFQSCSPAHYQERLRYSRKSWSTDDVFVVPQADGSCQVIRFQVAHAAEVGCRHVARWECDNLKLYASNEHQMDICFLGINGCGQPTDLEGDSEGCWL